jgi:hypothetical protein
MGSLRLGDPVLYVHTLMQNPNNFYPAGQLAVEDQMSTCAMSPVAVSNLSAILPHERIICQLLKASIEHCQIFETLIAPPTGLGETTDI